MPQIDQEIKSGKNLYHLRSSALYGQHLSDKTRESIHDGCREWRCCGTAQSPSASTTPSRNHPTPSVIPESTMLQEAPIIHPKMELTPDQFHRKKYEATNQLLEGAPCSSCTTRIRQEARRLECWSCKAKYHFNCMMSNCTQIVRTQTTQRWQCAHCSQKPVADSQDNQMAPV